VWTKWEPTQSLFLEKSNTQKYEIRLNENQRYEIKFGNNVTGKKLNAGDTVAVYYLRSNGTSGEVGPGLLDNNRLFFYNTPQFTTIKSNVIPDNLNLITSTQASYLAFSNIDASTQFVDIESVKDIKTNAINSFRSQYRLITSEDFTSYISKNYSNIISSTRAVNNWDYISGHLKYYFDLGVDKPNLQSRVLFNQVKFSDS
jgi:DNA-dependent RNA polymerase auxiliary subunit epsilon